jgi:hypothetical protein
MAAALKARFGYELLGRVAPKIARGTAPVSTIECPPNC